jgi:hypothetical protein
MHCGGSHLACGAYQQRGTSTLTNSPSFDQATHAQNVLIPGATFVSISRPQAEKYVVNKFFVNTSETQMKNPVPQKPNSSPLFTGRKDVIDQGALVSSERLRSLLKLKNEIKNVAPK